MKPTAHDQHDVAVVGGGPAGLYLAARLAERGFDVVVFEEHAAIGEPVHCTGLIASDTYQHFDVPPDSVIDELRVVQFFPPSGETIEYSTSRAEALVIDRGLFDRRLAERARERGVLLRLGAKIRDVGFDDGGVTVQTDREEHVRARVSVLACGANYSLHRRLGLGLPQAFLQSAQMEVPASRRGPVEVHFGDRVAPKGFAWVVPVDGPGSGRVRVGLMCASEAGAHFRAFLAGIAQRRGIDVACDGQWLPRLKMLPLAPIPRTFGDRLIAIGDAAGLVKATTGGGVYYGLVSATIAADVLTRALANDELCARSLARYEASWRKQLGAELRAQLSLRSIAQRLTDDEIEGLFDLARHDGVMPIVRRTARFNQHRELIVSLLKHPPVRRLLLHRLSDPVLRTFPLPLMRSSRRAGPAQLTALKSL